jgi:2-polyprenyl-6-methoxyphenol hydroxylase-like FAD-dependent oxidoreductase
MSVEVCGILAPQGIDGALPRKPSSRMTSDVDVLVVGAGPVGLTVACELRRRGVHCQIIDTLEAPPQNAKAVGIQPRTLEVWEDMGLVDQVLDVAVELRGQLLYVNGEEAARMELTLPPDIPYRFFALPQYETERLLTEHLSGLGLGVDRGVTLRSFTEDEDGVTATLDRATGEREIRPRYLVGCDGAHSAVRRGLNLSFEGDAFPEEYMLGDVEVDWSLPQGYAIRSLHQTDGNTDDLLVCIPLPGHHRYRVTMLVPPELASQPEPGAGVEHGFETGRSTPTLEHIQPVIDRLSPTPTTASNLRWSSVFRISHRLVDRYGDGRVFVAGDAAHIHPPTGAQGMNTGIQDAYNLAWKLALAAEGAAAPGLLESYDAERHPVGEEVVGRTVRDARSQYQSSDPEDPSTAILRAAQLLVAYPDSPLADESVDNGALAGGPRPGERAPDARGLHRGDGSGSARLFDLMRGTEPVLLLYAGAAAPNEAVRGFETIAAAGRELAGGQLAAYAVLAPGIDEHPGSLATLSDESGEFGSSYGAADTCLYLIRPDGYVGFRAAPAAPEPLLAYLRKMFRARSR